VWRGVEWMAAPWIVGVKIESKEKKRYEDELDPKRI
jgi:hypothetical protein